jgi:hypothetical protein
LSQNRKRRSTPNLELESPYGDQRKNYRKVFIKKEKNYISFRRNQDNLEGKIVNVINKMINGKNCAKDILHIVDKMGRLSGREMMSKYIVGGYETIVKLVLDENEKLGKQDKTEKEKDEPG